MKRVCLLGLLSLPVAAFAMCPDGALDASDPVVKSTLVGALTGAQVTVSQPSSAEICYDAAAKDQVSALLFQTLAATSQVAIGDRDTALQSAGISYTTDYFEGETVVYTPEAVAGAVAAIIAQASTP